MLLQLATIRMVGPTLELQTKCNFAKQFNKNFSGNVTKIENRVSVIVGNTSFRKNTEVKQLGPLLDVDAVLL